jgi:hypothetical protein
MYRSICQSCSMPLYDYNRGTEITGDLSGKFCSDCYERGRFKNPDISLADMEDQVAGILREKKHWPSMVAKIASRQIMNLERWNDHAHTRNDSSKHIYH